ncbi:Nodulin MtN3 family protein isoform 2 [Theobroma cacao]|uniref:Bidirectional sugar transporter SWEET n=2 Tax=Theobroma cacao TaxID=3641 RepID=A0A061F1H2_THECC|nr:Nodulin MtN3 family protein isoform 2 [Theobroma cacao]
MIFLCFLFYVGNIVSFLVFLAPVPTFYQICKKKTAEGYHSIPYMVALSSAMMLLYYGILKTNAVLIISINVIGCAIEIVYLVLYIIYAPKREKVSTMKFILLFNMGGYGLIILLTNLLTEGSKRVTVMGWICAVYNVAVFASPLSIMRHVVRTKSVEHMPFSLSLFLTLCATMWFFYGLFMMDFFIALPNVLGFLFGIAQMILYVTYKNANKDVEMQKEVDIELKQGSLEDVNPCKADQQQKMKEIKINVTEKPVESDKMNNVWSRQWRNSKSKLERQSSMSRMEDRYLVRREY